MNRTINIDEGGNSRERSYADYDVEKIPVKSHFHHKVLIFSFVLATIMPNYLHIGPLRLAPYLIIILLTFIPVAFIWIFGGLGRRYITDVLIFIACILASLSLLKNHEMSIIIEPAGIFFLQTFGAYLLGRYCVRDADSAYFMCIVLALAVISILPFAAVEALTGQKPYLRLFGMFGPVHADVVRPSRLGFERVQGSFEHPILFGVFIASLFSPLYFAIKSTVFKIIALAAVVTTTFFSLSVGAYLTLVVQIMLIAWGSVFSKYQKRWMALFLIALFLYITIDLGSNRTPFNVFVDYLTLNSGNAYNRILIFKFGTAEVLRYPFFGIGLNEWVRPFYMSSSMDNFWLVITVRYGIPTFALLLISIIIVLWRAGHRRLPSGELLRLRRGMIMSITAVMIAICSVHLWNATYAWLMFVIGSITWLMDAGRPPEASATNDDRGPADESAGGRQDRRSKPAPHHRRVILGNVQSPGAAKRGPPESARDIDQL